MTRTRVKPFKVSPLMLAYFLRVKIVDANNLTKSKSKKP